MKRQTLLLFTGVSVLGLGTVSQAFAAEDAAATSAALASEAEATATAGDVGLEERLALAKELHVYISTADRINQAIESVSLQLPMDRQDGFRTAMRNVLNYRVIEKISVDTMAELFTVDELNYLLEYHRSPHSAKVEEKFKTYEERVGPEIMRMLDKAMMRVRTGGAAAP